MSTNLDIKTSDIKRILEDVQKSLSAQAAEKLAKTAEESSPASASEEAPKEETAPPAPAADSAPPEASSPAPEAPMESAAPGEGQDPAQDEGMSHEQLEAEYSALPDDVLQAHYLAAKKALLARAAPAPAPMASPSAPAASPSAPPMAMKAELPAEKEMPVPKESAKQPIEKEVAMGKSEESNKEIETLKAQNAELSKGIEGLAKAMHTFIAKPVRKGITNLNIVERTEEKPVAKKLSKSEVREKTRDSLAKMSTKDRTKLLDFYEGKIDFEKIAHLCE